MRPLITVTLLCLFSTSYAFAAKNKSAQRIVALSPHAVEMLFAIGAGDRIIGVVEHSDFPKEALVIERVGNYTGVQIERIIELDPDLVVVWSSGNQTQDIKKLRSLGLNLFDSHPQNLADIGNEIIALGKLTGLEKQANTLSKTLAERYQEIKDKYKSKNLVKVFYQLWHDPFRTLGPESWISKMIEDCRGKNIFFDAHVDYPVVSLESILVKNPEVIIIPDHSKNAKAHRGIWESWQQISAVKNNQFYALDGDLLHRFSPRAIDGLEQLCQAIDKAR
ncbi:cobalamin-binding protein [Pleionea sediminis]|uniref:cobalamin-binding protein n=1 Tax=Pleionea sediminis TaxID=2569479 RepID=UPI001185AB27|nr:cobalamin-binding protein [Pleionea sediminis]